jgi:hypothetical protein
MTSPYPYPPHAAAQQKATEETNAAWGRRADDHLGNFKTLLERHTAEEMERYNEIIERLGTTEETVTSIDARIGGIETGQKAMNASILSFMEENGAFFAAIKRAFPKDDEGRPDYDGHKKAHLSWISNARDEKEVMEFVRRQMKDEEKSADLLSYVKKVIFAGAALAVVSFVAIAAWAAFLKGPVG